MQDVIAVAVRLDNGCRYFTTWGRVHDPVDPDPIAHVVLRNAHRYDLGGTPVSAEVCWSLQEASDEPYFHEALVEFASEREPRGPPVRRLAQTQEGSVGAAERTARSCPTLGPVYCSVTSTAR
jgi:hypothetical protein